MYAIPTIDNETGLENLEAVVEGSQIGQELVRSYPESLCGSLPAFEDELGAINDIFLTVNMGSTNLEVCAYRRGEQLVPLSTGSITGILAGLGVISVVGYWLVSRNVVLVIERGEAEPVECPTNQQTGQRALRELRDVLAS